MLWLTASRVCVRVDRLANFHRRRLQSLNSFSDLVAVFGSDGLVHGGDVPVDLVLHVLGDLVGVLLELSLGVVDCLVSLVFKVDLLSSLSVGFLGSFGIVHHLLDVGV